ncbi:DUF1295-domain-containing protein [Gloeophyllum trabeum ATCC 11539]|uniref:DUF1295-domain-containing protein n=1 Tax=Gloeophyllum trabeum (strain ATCC 11539 / FP-39264 / Madison 617) TaxID=670483 RepID=S7QAL6_GLOTA|nr:DUF1295-domain-containing protein [Gloeophyllum trabeum ATCC 11539]EPQ56428.1 DUF1295-domain-containing protein [Gloeophyllum trabeum ATCC 11539]
MAGVQVLDRYYLAITLLVTVGYQMLGFAIAWTFQFDKITDFTGGSNFFWLALMTLLFARTGDARNIVASVLVMVWAARLAGFLFFRVLKTGKDARFDDIRSHFLKYLGFWVWVVSLPVIILNSPSVVGVDHSVPFGTSRDIAGIVLWGVGWAIESIADIQKYRYKARGGPKDEPIRTGLWYFSRHPPYFGEILCWWGIWILCLSAGNNLGGGGKAALRGSVVSPIFTTLLLMFASGIPIAEKSQGQKFYDTAQRPGKSDAWDKYQEYLRSTSILIPIPPALYRPLPEIVKRTVLLDLPLYQFTGRDGAQILEDERGQS